MRVCCWKKSYTTASTSEPGWAVPLSVLVTALTLVTATAVTTVDFWVVPSSAVITNPGLMSIGPPTAVQPNWPTCTPGLVQTANCSGHPAPTVSCTVTSGLGPVLGSSMVTVTLAPTRKLAPMPSTRSASADTLIHDGFHSSWPVQSPSPSVWNASPATPCWVPGLCVGMSNGIGTVQSGGFEDGPGC